jgi:hypothetical protein
MLSGTDGTGGRTGGTEQADKMASAASITGRSARPLTSKL